MIHRIRTVYGDSNITYSGELGNWENWPQGVLQGNSTGVFETVGEQTVERVRARVFVFTPYSTVQFYLQRKTIPLHSEFPK